jgi:hypothetical protein
MDSEFAWHPLVVAGILGGARIQSHDLRFVDAGCLVMF